MDSNAMIFCIQKIYPNTKHGVDYWVAHPVNRDTLEQIDDPFVVQWNLDGPQPTKEQILGLWAQHQTEYQGQAAAEAARAKRVELLAEADILVETAIDKEDATAERAARKYRQALRDVPTQPGFPSNIAWPDKPA
ncbi:phage tail assembly chaperone [Burkholderia gladioli]|uniref:XkdW family protein n=1 Tax=Burkholderia gladioli TaxID=28095 RepID=UPI0016415176|nr:phage tail assembly chaperone [Burkholderia gladioli]